MDIRAHPISFASRPWNTVCATRARLRESCDVGVAPQLWAVRAPRAKHLGRARGSLMQAIENRGISFYDSAFTQTMMRGLVDASLGQVAVLSLRSVTGVLRAPQYP